MVDNQAINFSVKIQTGITYIHWTKLQVQFVENGFWVIDITWISRLLNAASYVFLEKDMGVSLLLCPEFQMASCFFYFFMRYFI